MKRIIAGISLFFGGLLLKCTLLIVYSFFTIFGASNLTGIIDVLFGYGLGYVFILANLFIISGLVLIIADVYHSKAKKEK